MSRFSGTLMAVAMGASLLAGSAAGQDQKTPQRFSIAVSGGSSKGAYEAGVNWAALKLVREIARLVTLTGGPIRPMEMASVTGASAGGVNTLLTGLTWCARTETAGGIGNSVDENLFRDIWLRVDINDLLPAKADSETYLPDDAVFSRKDYFAAANGLRDSWKKPVYRKGCRVPMGVTVTSVLPQELLVGDLEVQNQRFYIPFEMRVMEDNSIGFFFDPRDYPTVSDPSMILMPRPRSAPEFSISDDRVIGAVAATSAFPTAFGRRRLQYCRLAVRRSGAQAEPEEPREAPPDTDLVCPSGYELDEAEFADGGLFDNLPIGIARQLAEENVRAKANPLPVTYFYIDPNRIRYEPPKSPDKTACGSDNPPEACRTMEFSIFSESGLMLRAMGTARRYELYRETTSDHWQLNLSRLSYELSDDLRAMDPQFDCRAELPFFDPPIDCPGAIRRAGRLLEITYDRIKPLISPPYSVQRLIEAGVASNCERAPGDSDQRPRLMCDIDITRYRHQLAAAMMTIIERSRVEDQKLYVGISRSRQSIHHDRALRVSSRSAPITGTLLGDFGSFLDYKFREYDYYVGVYDAVVISSHNLCGLQYSRRHQQEEYSQCVNRLGRQIYGAIGVGTDPRARYVFARLAQREFADTSDLNFAYTPLPPVDRDMQIIHDGLAKALEAGEESEGDEQNVFVTEDTFFHFLEAENFVPTPTKDGREPLLAQIIDDPNSWSTEMARRISARLVYLERQSADVFAAREPDPDKREASYTQVMGAAAHLLQTATYKYPPITFSPSTAPEDWLLRYFIPYEFAFDLVEGDILLNWQPTAAITENNLVNLRIGLGFAGGLFRSSASKNRENYFGLGLGYIRRTGSATLSSFGFTPTWYHTWSQPEIGRQDSAGGDIHVSFMKDRLRVGLGTRDVRDVENTWFLTVGVMDLPGAVYWLTR
jgi:predicted acylesterase/phospholipase RssA